MTGVSMDAACRFPGLRAELAKSDYSLPPLRHKAGNDKLL